LQDFADYDLTQERRISALERSARNRRFTPTGALLAGERGRWEDENGRGDVCTPTPDQSGGGFGFL